MSAKEKILAYLKERSHEGALQSELYDLNYSRSTIAEAIESLERDRKILRRGLGKRHIEFGLLRRLPFR